MYVIYVNYNGEILYYQGENSWSDNLEYAKLFFSSVDLRSKKADLDQEIHNPQSWNQKTKSRKLTPLELEGIFLGLKKELLEVGEKYYSLREKLRSLACSE